MKSELQECRTLSPVVYGPPEPSTRHFEHRNAYREDAALLPGGRLRPTSRMTPTSVADHVMVNFARLIRGYCLMNCFAGIVTKSLSGTNWPFLTTRIIPPAGFDRPSVKLTV